jgi:hypothetical protein
MLLARLIETFDKDVSDRCLVIRSSRIVKLFIWSDFITLSLQSTGASLASARIAKLNSFGNIVRADYRSSPEIA